jgi:hypothetical protein
MRQRNEQIDMKVTNELSSKIPEGTSVAHFDRVLGFDWVIQMIYFEITIKDDEHYWSKSFKDFLG